MLSRGGVDQSIYRYVPCVRTDNQQWTQPTTLDTAKPRGRMSANRSSVRSRRRSPTKAILNGNNDDCHADDRLSHKAPVRRRRDQTSAVVLAAAALVGGGVLGCLGLILMMSGRLSRYMYDPSSLNDRVRSKNGSAGRVPTAKAITDMHGQVGYAIRPHMLQLIDDNSNHFSARALPRQSKYESTVTDLEVKSPWRVLTSAERRKQSNKYRDDYIKDGVEEPCVHQYSWQTSSLPTCNLVHEGNWGDEDALEPPKRVNHGGWVEIWKLPEWDGNPIALKSKLYDVDFTKRNFDRYRRDAVCLERLSPSPLILDIYSFCGVTAFIQYCAKGDLDRAIRKRGENWTSAKKVQIAIQVMDALATVHNVDREGRASFAHSDITTDQYLSVGDDNFILNDFNRMRAIGWDKAKDEACGFTISNNPGNWRSPEEYRYDSETEKVDIYSAGNVLYQVLTLQEPFELEGFSEKQVHKAVMEGDRPHISQSLYRDSDDPKIQALVRAIDLCWKQDPRERPTAREVVDLLQSALGNSPP